MRHGLHVESLEQRRVLAADVTALAGDVNFDGRFDSADLVEMFQAGRYETEQSATWAEGDFSFDGKFDSTDLVVAFQEGLYETRAVAAEPGEEEQPSTDHLQAHIERLQAAIDSGNLPLNLTPEEATTLVVGMQAALESGDFGPLRELRASILGDRLHEHDGRPEFDVDFDQIRARLAERWGNIDELVDGFRDRVEEWRAEWQDRFDQWRDRVDGFFDRWGDRGDDGDDAGDVVPG